MLGEPGCENEEDGPGDWREETDAFEDGEFFRDL